MFENAGYRSPELEQYGSSIRFTIRARRHPVLLLLLAVWLAGFAAFVPSFLRSAPASYAPLLPLLGIFLVMALVMGPMLMGKETIELTPEEVRFRFSAGPYAKERSFPTSSLSRVRELGRPGLSWASSRLTRQYQAQPAPSLAFEFREEIIRCGEGLSEGDAPLVLEKVQEWMAQRRR